MAQKTTTFEVRIGKTVFRTLRTPEEIENRQLVFDSCCEVYFNSHVQLVRIEQKYDADGFESDTVEHVEIEMER